jgi:uncharacterized membrane protein YgaE (UPF0421/DUF939 family)
MFRGVFIVTGPLIGLLIASFGMHITLAILGAVVGLFFTLWLIPLLGEIRERVVKVQDQSTIVQATRTD